MALLYDPGAFMPKSTTDFDEASWMLTWRDVSRRPFVKKGELVEVTANDGTLLITMKALAMENGAQGESVIVRNPESRKNFTALVIDENRVQVRF